MVDPKRGIYCDCLEKKLPKGSKQSIKAFPLGEELDRLRVDLVDPEKSAEGLEIELSKYLDPYEVELIMARIVYNQKIKDIAKELGWISESSVSHHIQAALKKLRSGRFTL